MYRRDRKRNLRSPPPPRAVSRGAIIFPYFPQSMKYYFLLHVYAFCDFIVGMGLLKVTLRTKMTQLMRQH